MADQVRISDATGMDAWLQLSDVEQLAEVARYLGPAAKERLLQHGRIKNHRYSLNELAQLRAAQPAFPAGEPSDQWSPEELRAYLDVKQIELDAQPRPAPQIKLDQLDDQQLKQLAAATTQTEADQLLDRFTAEAHGQRNG
jgi:hypothetical protein